MIHWYISFAYNTANPLSYRTTKSERFSFTACLSGKIPLQVTISVNISFASLSDLLDLPTFMEPCPFFLCWSSTKKKHYKTAIVLQALSKVFVFIFYIKPWFKCIYSSWNVEVLEILRKRCFHITRLIVRYCRKVCLTTFGYFLIL